MSKPLCVLQLITELRPAGAECIVYELARGLPKERFQVHVASLRPATGAVAGWLREAGIPVHDLGMCCKFDPRAPRRLLDLLRRERIELVHSHLFHANVLARHAARKADICCVGTVHIAERRFMPWRFWLERRALGPEGQLVCVSNAVREFMHNRAKIPKEQMRVIHNGVDISRFEPWQDAAKRKAAAEALRKQCGVQVESKVALAVGRLEVQKNYGLLLEAWTRVCAKDNSAALAIVGEGSERAKLQAQAERLGIAKRVHWLGHRDDVPALLAGSDVFALSSAYEGFGLAVAEAMASGLPVVAVAVDSIPEVLGNNEMGSGLTVPPFDADAFGMALTRTLKMSSEERSTIGERGRLRAYEKFDAKRMVNDYENLYLELIHLLPT